jgi:hypothetical protein
MTACSGSILRCSSLLACSIAKLGPVKPSIPRFVPIVAAPVLTIARMRSKGMDPPQNELPAGWRSPFQPLIGIQSSNRTSEFSTRVAPATRQNAERSENAAGAVPPAPCGGLKVPAGTN